MSLRETKRILFLLFILTLVLFDRGVFAQNFSSINFTVTNPVIDQGGPSSASGNFGLGQSVGQTAIGKSTSGNFQLWSGFQYYFRVNANVLTPTAGSGQVSLSWTVPQTFLGIAVSSYEVGTGVVSGSYVFEDVGNVTNFIKGGLTNGTQYFFIIKAKSAGGLFLVYSNEATATPVAAVSPPPAGGGAPPPYSPGTSLIVKGLAYPTSQVTLLRDNQIVAATTADPGAAFNVELNGINPGTYAFGVYSTDVEGQKSPTFVFTETFTTGVTITVDNIFLGPSIGLSHSIIKKGDTITIFGYTVPTTPVKVFVNSPIEYIESVQSTASGSWVKAFNTAVLDLGSHSSRSQAEKNNLISSYSHTVGFAVGDKSVEVPEGECRRSDLNCDGRVNLTDFSILLFYWQQSAPANARANINNAGLVDLTDFSIMLFDWTG
jgi:hypothetical protein